MNAADLQAKFMLALYESKPVTVDMIVAIARESFGDHLKELNEFTAWLEKNQDYLLNKVNA